MEPDVKLIEDIKIIELKGLSRRLLLILKAHGRHITPTMIKNVISQAFLGGTIDRDYSFNWICIILRNLESLKLISKREDINSRGKSVLYVINAFGLKQLYLNLGISNNNNSSQIKGNREILV